MTNQPKVSIFLPYYNDKDFLNQSIDAILAQDFTDFELILLNHATLDNSRNIAHSYNDPRIVHIDKEFNYGAGCGLLMRDMLKIARGEYIKFCCADDLFHKNCLSELVNYLDNNPDCGFVSAKMDFIDDNGNFLPPVFDESKETTSRGFLKSFYNAENGISFPTVMIRKSVLEKTPIDATFIMMLDLSLWTESLCNGQSLAVIDKELVSYRIHKKQLSYIYNSCSFVERMAFADIFYKLRDLDLIKFLCKDVEYSKSLTKKDEKFFPFILALRSLKSNNMSFVFSGYLYIHKLMNDDKMRDEIFERFGFGVADFRKIYTHIPSIYTDLNTEFKKIPAWKLLALLMRRIFRVFAPKNYTKIIKKLIYKTKRSNA